MQKIPTMFVRDETLRGYPVIDQIKPECKWVQDGEGFATQKIDGTNVKIEGGLFYRRQKPLTEDYDEASYVPCRRDDPNDRYLWEAFDGLEEKVGAIYEAVGPKIQGNKEGHRKHILISVSPPDPRLWFQIPPPRSFLGLREFLETFHLEGLVFHHSDGRMCKIKRRDFGFRW